MVLVVPECILRGGSTWRFSLIWREPVSRPGMRETWRAHRATATVKFARFICRDATSPAERVADRATLPPDDLQAARWVKRIWERVGKIVPAKVTRYLFSDPTGVWRMEEWGGSVVHRMSGTGAGLSRVAGHR